MFRGYLFAVVRWLNFTQVKFSMPANPDSWLAKPWTLISGQNWWKLKELKLPNDL
jgi:hypothetical protein